MEPLKITSYHYFPESDELDLVINVPEARPAISIPLDDEFFFLRVAPDSGEIVGGTILYASRWFAELAQAFASRSFDNPDVHLLLEKKLEALVLQQS